MSQSGVVAWSQTAASNATADSAVNWAEGMAPSAVNDSARAEMASVAKYRDDTAGALTTGGTSTAYTLATNQSFSALSILNGQELSVKFNATNGASPTLNVDSLGAKAINIDTATGVGTGVIKANSIWSIVYDNSNSCFILKNVPASIQDGTVATASIASQAVTAAKIANNTITASQIAVGVVPVLPPLGRLTPTSGSPVISSEVTAATTIYYAPYAGNQVPIYDGTSFSLFTFSELSLALDSSSQAASGIYDVFVFSNSGSAALAFGPSWTGGTSGSVTAGSCARGTGSGGTALTRVNGILVNAAAFSSANNGSTTYAIAANKGTYLGSVFVDGTNGQVSCHLSYGQSRKWGIWNAYNRVPVTMIGGDSTSSWTWASSSYHSSNATAANTIALFCGLAEESAKIKFVENVTLGISTNGARVGIGWNSTTAASGFSGQAGNGGTAPQFSVISARYDPAPFLGVNNANMLESSPGAVSNTFIGGNPGMQMTVQYRA